MKPQTIVGIYKITSPSGKVYIGQSWNIYRRWEYYKYRNQESARQFHLTNSFMKHGYKAHVFEIIHELPADVTQEVLDRYEQFYMDQYRACGVTLLNCKEAGSYGKHSADSIERIAAAQRGTKKSQSTRDKISFANTQRVLSQETKDKIGSANTGRVFTQQHRDKISIAGKGVKKPEGHGANVSKGTKGVPKSEAHKKALSESRISKGTASGANNPRAKLTEEIVKEIRAKYVPVQYSITKLAKEYGLSKSAMFSIVSGKNWPNV